MASFPAYLSIILLPPGCSAGHIAISATAVDRGSYLLRTVEEVGDIVHLAWYQVLMSMAGREMWSTDVELTMHDYPATLPGGVGGNLRRGEDADVGHCVVLENDHPFLQQILNRSPEIGLRLLKAQRTERGSPLGSGMCLRPHLHSQVSPCWPVNQHTLAEQKPLSPIGHSVCDPSNKARP